ncbi:MAG: DNA polymerase III subunit gamma/tau [Patescibacteria group bacterium]
MSHISLYRKYRPSTFAEVIGQEAIVKALQGALESKSISHAYLFCGSRGTGKTSIARIFAKAVGTSSNDLVEIDAASNRGIDDIRELREAVHTLPFESRYKIYIIDEVHMLTKEAFNALLKTLEEPPAHAIFILATTEFDKLPETVVSRCQLFTFKKPSRELLKGMVLAVAKKEGKTIDPAGADLIALLGEGSFRDTHGILEKVLSGIDGKTISLEAVESATGAPRHQMVDSYCEALITKNASAGLSILHKASEQNIDMKVFLSLTLEKLRFALLFLHAKDMENYIKSQVSAEEFAFLQTLGKHPDLSPAIISQLLSVYDSLASASIPTLPLELATIAIAGK